MDAITETATLRIPTIADAAGVWALIKRCPPLDVNSSYAYLVLARDFAQTCVVATRDRDIVGFVSGYVPPERPGTLFVWQVAVDERARGEGLGRRMILDLLARDPKYRYLETTVSPSNAASRRMFERVAGDMNAGLREEALFTREHLGEVDHEEECLLIIGPFGRGNERETRGENTNGERNNQG